MRERQVHVLVVPCWLRQQKHAVYLFSFPPELPCGRHPTLARLARRLHHSICLVDGLPERSDTSPWHSQYPTEEKIENKGGLFLTMAA